MCALSHILILFMRNNTIQGEGEGEEEEDGEGGVCMWITYTYKWPHFLPHNH
jgi:hypothetical protein